MQGTSVMRMSRFLKEKHTNSLKSSISLENQKTSVKTWRPNEIMCSVPIRKLALAKEVLLSCFNMTHPVSRLQVGQYHLQPPYPEDTIQNRCIYSNIRECFCRISKGVRRCTARLVLKTHKLLKVPRAWKTKKRQWKHATPSSIRIIWPELDLGDRMGKRFQWTWYMTK